MFDLFPIRSVLQNKLNYSFISIKLRFIPYFKDLIEVGVFYILLILNFWLSVGINLYKRRQNLKCFLGNMSSDQILNKQTAFSVSLRMHSNLFCCFTMKSEWNVWIVARLCFFQNFLSEDIHSFISVLKCLFCLHQILTKLTKILMSLLPFYLFTF